MASTVWDQMLEDNPERATFLGKTQFADRWTDRSGGAIDQRRRRAVQFLARARQIETLAVDLEPEDHLSLHLLRYGLEVEVEGHSYPTELLPLSQLGGVHHAFAVIDAMPATSAEECATIATRLAALPLAVDQTIERMVQGIDEGVTHPAVALRDVPRQIAELAATRGTQSPFLAWAAAAPASASDVVRHAQAVVESHVLPALSKLATFLADTYLPSCRTSTALSALPDGAAWYEHLCRLHTTTARSPKQIHEAGLDEVDRIGAEIEVLASECGYGGRAEEFTAFLRTDPSFFFQTPDELVGAYREITKRIDGEIPRLFRTLPRLPYGVRPVPAHQAASAVAAYYQPGSAAVGRAGWFMANAYAVEQRPRWEMEAIALHEAVPGHHLQVSLAQELEGLPEFRRVSSHMAYVEGWGLYAESLGAELGLFADPYSRYGRLACEMWRAVRLVVDTGLHALGWSRDEAIAYFGAHTAKLEHDIVVEVDRYIVNPGQALSYKMGELAITRLRREAEAALGQSFDVRSFHDMVLGAGPLPLEVLERRGRAWIEAAVT